MKTNSHVHDGIQIMNVTSPAFNHYEYIPEKYTCDGENINPPFVIHKIPKHTKSMVLLMDDVNAGARCKTHWLVWNIEPGTYINESSTPGIQGISDFKLKRYTGPCQDTGTHAFQFRIFALSAQLNLNSRSGKSQVNKEMAPYVIGFGFIGGVYKRNLRITK